MTIKDIETRTGLPRANVRYYESEGLISPGRGGNGYRDYSQQDLDTLLKIKLLRQLRFSLDDIRALQLGELDLDRALEAQIQALSREEAELDLAARLCLDLQGEGASYSSLDASRYLDRLAQWTSVLDQDRLPRRIFPWRRYFARYFDLSCYQTLYNLFLQFFFRQNVQLESLSSRFFTVAASLLLMLLLEPLFLHFWGSTPGKALFGLRITREDGSLLSIPQAFQRTFTVIACGMGLGIPLVALALPIWSCYCVYHDKPLAWEGENQVYSDGSDKEHSYWDKNSSWGRLLGLGVSYALAVGLLWCGQQYAMTPRYHGPGLTTEQFVDNYNQFSAFRSGKDALAQELTADGTFQPLPHTSSAIALFPGGDTAIPFSFQEENGALTSVTLSLSSDSGEIRPSLPTYQMQVSAWAFLYGRPGIQRGDLWDILLNMEYYSGSFHYDLPGAVLDCQLEWEGYQNIGSMLIPTEGESQQYRMTYTIALTG